MNRVPLTFGVEIEALATIARGGYPLGVGQCHHEGLFTDLANDLTDAGLPACSGYAARGRYDQHGVVVDGSIEAPAPIGDTELRGFELRTRVLSTRAFSDGIREIDGILRVLHGRWQVGVNNSTGLHIHVGMAEDPWHLVTVKNLAALVVGFEHVINEIIPDYRLSTRHGGMFTLPASVVRGEKLGPGPLGLLAHLKLIKQCTSLDQIAQVVSQGKKYVQVNFLGVKPGSRLPTVEFRYFPGTVDAERILSYIELVTGLVEYAHVAHPREVEVLLHRAFDKRFNFFSLLEVIGREHLKEGFKPLWKPETRLKGLEPPWDPMWLRPGQGRQLVRRGSGRER